MSQGWLADAEASVRASALRLIGEVGCDGAMRECAAVLTHSDPECRFWGAWSSVVIGNRGAGLKALADAGVDAGPHRDEAFCLSLQAMTVGAAHKVLQSLARLPEDLRYLIQGSGIVGDPVYVPWLITHMSNEQSARLAGEAFSLLTGADLALLNLERKTPENFESGPNDNPDDPNIESDPDDNLLWPDPKRVEDWWSKHGSRFQSGQRYFMGAPVTREHCIEVLKNGYQRQRILAAHYLCLLEPGTPLFNTSAPAWRQQRLLAGMN